MTFFTDSPFERMMIQKPDYGRRDDTPPRFPPKCDGCPYRGQSPCIGYCIRKIKDNKKSREPER